MSDIVIASAARTPIGSFSGALSTLPAHDLGKVAIEAALERAGVQPNDVSEVILGQILSAGQGQNPARQASMNAGVPMEVPAWGVNQLCGSGLRTVALGYQAIKNGDSQIVVAGGQESMSQAPHCTYLRPGVKMGSAELVDTIGQQSHRFFFAFGCEQVVQFRAAADLFGFERDGQLMRDVMQRRRGPNPSEQRTGR